MKIGGWEPPKQPRMVETLRMIKGRKLVMMDGLQREKYWLLNLILPIAVTLQVWESVPQGGERMCDEEQMVLKSTAKLGPIDGSLHTNCAEESIDIVPRNDPDTKEDRKMMT